MGQKTVVATVSGLMMFLVALAVPLLSAEELIPAGTVVQCRVPEKISSLVTGVGDPVICQITSSTVFPYGSDLTGRFEDYKDPGHFIGKGWMELHFERIVMTHGRVLPVSAKVVGVKGYRTDNQGRILGNGHATRDIVTWSIPILWPIDLLMLPRRGPRPTLKAETAMTVKLMDDVAFETAPPRQIYPPQFPPRDGYGFTERPPDPYAPPNPYTGPAGYVEPPSIEWEAAPTGYAYAQPAYPMHSAYPAYPAFSVSIPVEAARPAPVYPRSRPIYTGRPVYVGRPENPPPARAHYVARPYR